MSPPPTPPAGPNRPRPTMNPLKGPGPVEEMPGGGAEPYWEADDSATGEWYEEIAEEEAEEEEPGGGGGWVVFMSLVLSLLLLGLAAYGIREIVSRGYLDQVVYYYGDSKLLPSKNPQVVSDEDAVQIYLARDARFLAPTPRRLRRETVAGEKARLLLAELVASGADAALSGTLPPGTVARGLYQVGNTAYVDLSAQFQRPSNPTPRGERLAVHSIVNTLTLNVPDIDSVQILVEGGPVKTAWGWLDLTAPLGPDLSLVQ